MDSVRGLFGLHANGILHCDTKLNDVFTLAPDDLLPANGKIMDFGPSQSVRTSR